MARFRARSVSRDRFVLGVLALYVTAALILLTPVSGALGGAGEPPLPPPPGVGASADAATDRGTPPELGSAHAQRAREILAADRSLAAALGGAPHSIVKSGPWTTSGTGADASRLLGAAFVVAPEKPIELRAVRLPGALYDQSERADPPYQSVVNTVSGNDVAQFLVLVDLQRRKVVNISPGPGAKNVESVPPPGFRRTVPVPVEGGR